MSFPQPQGMCSDASFEPGARVNKGALLSGRVGDREVLEVTGVLTEVDRLADV